MFMIREAKSDDLSGLLKLYTFLNNNKMPVIDSRVTKIFQHILSEADQHLLVCECDRVIASTVTVTVLQSLTHGQRPYALVEHVVTHPSFRGRGLALSLLAEAEKIANTNGCYKIMLITGQQSEEVHKLYRKAGFCSDGKTAYIKALLK